jgi:hypothetical protein
MTVRTDLTAVFRRQLFGLPDEAGRVGFRGSRGWLVASGVADVVAPFVTHLPSDDGDLARFAGLDAPAAADLLERLTSDQLSDRQNDAPTLGNMLRAAVAHPSQIELHGYLVGPARDDERITAEGVYVYGASDLAITARHDPGRLCEDLWAVVQRDLAVDDARAFPDEIIWRLNRWRPEEPCWSLWWD